MEELSSGPYQDFTLLSKDLKSHPSVNINVVTHDYGLCHEKEGSPSSSFGYVRKRSIKYSVSTETYF